MFRMAKVIAACPEDTRQRSVPAFQCGHPLFKRIRRRVHDAGIDIAHFRQCEQIGCMIRVAKTVRSRLIDRHCTDIVVGSMLLSGMYSQCFQLKLAFF